MSEEEIEPLEEQDADICPCCNRPYDIPKTRKPRAKKAPATDFDAFWSAYPKKTAKPYCKAIWDRKGLTLDMVLPALKKAIASRDWQKEGGEFIPNPSTWLNQGRYEDEGMDYQALRPEKPTITSRLGIDEEAALEWRSWAYPESIKIHPTWQTFPFKSWPKSTQREYIATIK